MAAGTLTRSGPEYGGAQQWVALRRDVLRVREAAVSGAFRTEGHKQWAALRHAVLQVHKAAIQYSCMGKHYEYS